MTANKPPFEILAYIVNGQGWDPINHMVELAASMFGARLRTFENNDWKEPSTLSLASIALRGRKRVTAAPDALVIVDHAPSALYFLTDPNLRSGYNRVFLWIIDSFWTERIPRFPLGKVFDGIFIMYGPDADEYRERTGIATYNVGWGADALGLGRGPEIRDLDILRVGRQPEIWNDNKASAARMKAFGLTLEGPTLLPDQGRQPSGYDRMAHITSCYRRAKFILAHSNLAAPKPYVHPTKEYITGRWSSAISCGAVVAGVQPLSDPVFSEILWPEAYLHTESFDPEVFAPILARASEEWAPDIARKNQLMALKRLDWRWKFKKIADVIGGDFRGLQEELSKLNAAIARLEQEDDAS